MNRDALFRAFSSEIFTTTGCSKPSYLCESLLTRFPSPSGLVSALSPFSESPLPSSLGRPDGAATVGLRDARQFRQFQACTSPKTIQNKLETQLVSLEIHCVCSSPVRLRRNEEKRRRHFNDISTAPTPFWRNCIQHFDGKSSNFLRLELIQNGTVPLQVVRY